MIYVGLFEESGIMALPFAEFGWECHCFDIDQSEIGEKVIHPNITYHEIDLLTNGIFEVVPRADFVAGFPPCTDLASSGAAWWAKKRAANPRFQEDAMKLVYRVKEIADHYNAAYFIENPKGVITKMWRKWDYRFHPYEYSGFAEEDCYTKETFLWTGNGFKMPQPIICEYCVTPEKQAIRNINAKGDRRRRLRSKTPRGFAEAVATENCTA